MRTSTAKGRAKLQARLGALKLKHFYPGGCWVCGSRNGLKTHREANGQRCRECFVSGKTTPDVEEYERLREQLEHSKDKR